MGYTIGSEMVQATNPYYRSTYVLVAPKGSDLAGPVDRRSQAERPQDRRLLGDAADGRDAEERHAHAGQALPASRRPPVRGAARDDARRSQGQDDRCRGGLGPPHRRCGEEIGRRTRHDAAAEGRRSARLQLSHRARRPPRRERLEAQARRRSAQAQGRHQPRARRLQRAADRQSRASDRAGDGDQRIRAEDRAGRHRADKSPGEQGKPIPKGFQMPGPAPTGQ